jgi:hypothetical protein
MVGYQDTWIALFDVFATLDSDANPIEAKKAVNPGSLEGGSAPPGTVEQAENTTGGGKKNR